jgi:hypothetical protein
MYDCSRQFDVFINGGVSLTSSITAGSVAQTQMDIAAGCATVLAMGLPVVESIFDNNDHRADRAMEEQSRPVILDCFKETQESNPNDYVSSDDNE